MMQKLILFLLLLAGSFGLSAQLEVSGMVTDTDGFPLIGATVLVKGTKGGTATDATGAFTLEVAPDAILVFSYTGYKSQEVAVNKRTRIDPVLETEAEILDKVVVIGYGSVKKEDLTGAIGGIEPTQDQANQVEDVQSLLQGRIAGVRVNRNGSEPGSPLSIRIRGTNSLRGDNEPLYVIDGIIVNSSTEDAADPLQGGSSYLSAQNGLTGLNPQDIESIQVLKDASATAIYGSRGANGVILITTKKGTKGKPSFTFNSFLRSGQATRLVEVLNTEQYIDYQNESREIRGFSPAFYTYDDGSITPFVESVDFLEAKADSLPRVTPVNWYDDILENSLSQNYRLSVQGGGAKGQYFLAGGFSDTRGVIPNAIARTGDFLFKYRRELSDRIDVGLRLSGAFVNNSASKGTENLGSTNASVIRQIVLAAPLLGFAENNLTTDFEETLDGPRAWLTDYDDESKEFRTLASFDFSYKISDIFSYRLQFGGDYRDKERLLFYGPGLQRGLNVNGEAGRSELDRFRYNIDNTLRFKTKLGRGQRLNGTVGFVWDATNIGQRTFSASDFPNLSLRAAGIETGRASTPEVYETRDEALVSFLGRTNYSLKGRYLVTASFRADGTSKFAPGKKFSFFPALALAWRLNEEKFLAGLRNLSDAKLRFGFGLTGSQAIRPYQTLARYGPTLNQVSDANGNPLPSIAPLNLANGDLRWETTRQFNAGFDFGLWNNRVTATVDVYHKRTYDLLQQFNIGPSAGFETITANKGDLVNRGLELSASANLARGKFNWNVNANISVNRNEIQDLGLPETDFGTRRAAAFLGQNISGGSFFKVPANIFIEGEAAGLFWGYATDGIISGTGELEGAPDVFGIEAQLGDVRYVDQNGDGNITESDLTVIGDPNPEFSYGFGMDFDYRNFTLSFLFNGVHGNDIANGNLSRSAFTRGVSDNVRTEAYLDAWRPDNPDGAFPRINYANPGDFTDRFLQDGSFLRLAFVSLGYSLPKNTLKGIEQVDFFVSGQNLLLLTDYNGFDPEVDSFSFDPGRRGVDWGAFPRQRSVTFGLTLGF